jgi:hypothetical protein
MRSWITPRQLPVAIIILAGSLALVVWLVSWVVSVATLQHGSINITRDNYQAALVKWRSQGIEEYEMDLDMATPKGGRAGCLGCGTYTLKVHGKDVTLLNYVSPTVGYASPAGQDELSQSYIIDGLFADVDRMVTAGPMRCDRFPETLIFDYTIRFDPQLGYPTFIGETSRDTEGHPMSTLECGGGILTEVRSFKVIKRSAP